MKKLIALVALAACLFWPARSQAMYVDGMNVYQYVQVNPANALDPMGTVIYLKPGELTEGEKEMRKRAQKWFDDWYAAQKADMSWNASLPACPCKITCTATMANNPDSTTWDDPHRPTYGSTYHPGASWEVRTTKAKAGSKGQGEQCTYDAKGNLITHGSGAGTADRISSNLWLGGWDGVAWYLSGTNIAYPPDQIPGHGGHNLADVQPFDIALWLDQHGSAGNVNKYVGVRPNNNKNNCPQNP